MLAKAYRIVETKNNHSISVDYWPAFHPSAVASWTLKPCFCFLAFLGADLVKVSSGLAKKGPDANMFTA